MAKAANLRSAVCVVNSPTSGLGELVLGVHGHGQIVVTVHRIGF